MPRKIAINERPNPTGLSMAERQLAICVIQSLRASVVRARKDMQQHMYWRDTWDVDKEQKALDRVCRAAMNQLAGRQKTEAGLFQLHYDGEIKDEDMDYIRQSLGVS